MTTATLIKENWGSLFNIQFLIIMAGHGGMQAGMVLEKELRVLHLAGNRRGSVTVGGILSIYEIAKPTSTVTHVL